LSSGPNPHLPFARAGRTLGSMMAMGDHQEIYDDGMFEYSQGGYDAAIERFQAILNDVPDHFDARLALAMCLYRKGQYTDAIVEGHKAETLRPNEQLVHTNLSLFYMKAGEKTKAEHHGLQARIASWKGNMGTPQTSAPEADADLQMAQPKPKAFKLPEKFPDMPWKNKK
jgi:tetratricopeptide (TPR) repeat protein